ncbi:iron-sulfur cluster insertion protein ErpA [Blochmannia endosymbiont of Camponotus (Colobopsis) obliquus]|uniref:iron-sulfur cluster insertion protein ErpA n=1 Tax=Blochmannia endosymbiont of Camponotus (Colobopsis) obliquus TaxID=1505597 RepID=UPI00061A5920|nr:iron-sulfur cluster insertion protein ErpA [Blochmannia endosymbiont of Camponotus (Colobopsis) obliquus]AKC60330.1 iron-sulfur cluster insertion protein erpA [Blochmannia endosymbiont of Camponotus (Colobopsis) obliquus]
MTDNKMNLLLQFTDVAAKKVNNLIEIQGNKNLKLRVYIIGGGCSGFQYGFILDELVNDGDYCVEKCGAILVVDPLSLQYLIGGLIDYHEEIKGSRFIVINPNAKNTCSCGLSFNI